MIDTLKELADKAMNTDLAPLLGPAAVEEARRKAHEECPCCAGARPDGVEQYGDEECGGSHDAWDRVILLARLDEIEAVHRILDGREVEFGASLEIHARRDALRAEVEKHGK